MTTPDPIDINAIRNTTQNIEYDKEGKTFRDFVLSQVDPTPDDGVITVADAGWAAEQLDFLDT
jgi:hypothetical protein